LRTNGDTASYNTLDRWVSGGNPTFLRYEDAHAIVLAAARELHQDAQEKKRAKIDARKERRQQKKAVAPGPNTISELIAHWMGPGKRGETATGREVNTTLNKVLAAYLDKPIGIFEGKEGVKLGRQILSPIAFEQGHAAMALLVKRLMSALFNHAIEIGKLDENPVSKIELKNVKVGERNNYLNAAEITLNLRASTAMGPVGYGLITWLWDAAVRRGEISGLKWADVDPDRRTATFRDTKNGSDFTIYITDICLPPWCADGHFCEPYMPDRCPRHRCSQHGCERQNDLCHKSLSCSGAQRRQFARWPLYGRRDRPKLSISAPKHIIIPHHK
jgi:hypothetical protein